MPTDTAKTSAQPSSSPPVSDVRRCYVREQYPALVRNNRLRASELVRLRVETSNFEYRPLLSVLLPVFNPEQEWLERGLDSMVRQVYPGWELCVCSDGSTEERVREILNRYERLDERIKVTHLEG